MIVHVLCHAPLTELDNVNKPIKPIYRLTGRLRTNDVFTYKIYHNVEIEYFETLKSRVCFIYNSSIILLWVCSTFIHNRCTFINFKPEEDFGQYINIIHGKIIISQNVCILILLHFLKNNFNLIHLNNLLKYCDYI